MRPYIPPYLDEDWIAQAEAALKCPATEADADLGARSTRPRSGSCRTSCTRAKFTNYRIDRVPAYELVRCGLEEPAVRRAPPYTGMPATGP